MKRRTTAAERAYYDAQSEIMQEMRKILDRRTSTNGAEITAQLEALQRSAFPEFYRNEPQQIEQTRPAQPETVQDETEPDALTLPQIVYGLFLYFSMPIRRAQSRRKDR